MKKNEIKSGAFLSYIIILVNTIAGLLVTPFMIRTLGQDMYGLYELIGSFVSYLNLMDFGIATTIVRYISKYRAENRQKDINKFISTILRIYSITGILVASVGIVIYFNLGKIFSSSISLENLPTAKLMFGISIINMTLTMFMKAFPAIINAYEKFVFSKLLDLSRILIRTIFIFICLKLGFNVVSIIIIDTVLNLLLMILRITYIKLNINIKLEFTRIDLSFAKEIFGFSIFVFLSSFINTVNTKLDQFMLGILSTTTQIAISGVAVTVMNYYHTFSTALSGVLLPKITRLVSTQNGINEIRDFSIKVSRLQGKILMLMIVGFALIGRDFIYLWAGPGYEDVYYIVLVLMISNILPYTQGALLSITQAMNKHATRNIIYFFITLANIILTIPLAKNYGAIGASIATALTTGIGYAVFIQSYYQKVIRINMFNYMYETIIKLIPITLVVYVIGNMINMILDGMIFIILKIFIIISIYGTLVWFVDTSSFEKNLIKNMLNKINIFYRRNKYESNKKISV